MGINFRSSFPEPKIPFGTVVFGLLYKYSDFYFCCLDFYFTRSTFFDHFFLVEFFLCGLLVLLDGLRLLNLYPAVFGVILACFLRYHFFYILPMYWLCRLGRFPIRSTRR